MGQAVPARAILIVEDEPFVRFDLMDFFEDRGFRVFGAGDAEEAIALLEADDTIRIVFTDIQMPGAMDGLMLAHHIRERWPPTLLIVASGRVTPRDVTLPARAAFVGKPFDPREVLQEIERRSV
ncbi:response regulator [Rhizosaccharibacter radicis]|uniref:Response regulator n=1 Tax=Rhizosaccharibacter radicis TaxID=2782605 RepID=A0ABT1VUB8_9PROT|nr:response regulator [Acetobacteraceae bacterium KSS12]